MEDNLVKQTLIDSLLPGDVLLYSPSGLIPFLIRIKTWSRFSHCEVYLGSGLSAAARIHGVKTYLLDSSFTAILRPEVPENFSLDITEAKKFHNSCIGQKYDTLGLFRFFTIGKQSEDKQFCSELATRICRHFLLMEKGSHRTVSFRPFAERWDADLVSPGMFYSSPHFNLIWEDKGSVSI